MRCISRLQPRFPAWQGLPAVRPYLEPACLLEFDKEIVIQCYGYAAEQFGVNAALAQDFVNIGAVATNLLGQPCRRAALTAQFVAD